MTLLQIYESLKNLLMNSEKEIEIYKLQVAITNIIYLDIHNYSRYLSVINNKLVNL